MFSDPSFWVFVSFVIFVGLLLYKRVPAMLIAMIDRQRQAIADELEGARSLHEEARQLRAEAEKRYKQAEEDAAAIITQAEADTERLKNEMRAIFDERLQRRMRAAEARILSTEATARRDLRDSLAVIVVESVRDVLKTQMTPKIVALLINDGVDHIRKHLAQRPSSATAGDGEEVGH